MATIELPEWIVFDGDNTLWSTERIYDKARRQFCETLASDKLFISTVLDKTADEIEEYQKKRDKQLYKLFGYSSARFGRSFEDTIRYFLPGHSEENLTDLIREARRLADSVFAERARPYPGIENLLKTLKMRGVRLGLLTAGELWVQQKRCQEFPFTGLFDWLKITDKKKAEILPRLTSRYKVPATKCLFVGDSLVSDVIPALQNGLTAIWVAHPNWDNEQAHGRHQVSKDEESLAEALNREGLDPTKAELAENIDELLSKLGLDSRQPPTIYTDPPMLAYGVFEGGGAKGLAHFGAFQACRDRNIKFIGLAGTSAGSIAAGLIAVGYRPKDLFHEKGGGLLDKYYHEIIGTTEWKRGKRLINLLLPSAKNSSESHKGSKAWYRWLKSANSKTAQWLKNVLASSYRFPLRIVHGVPAYFKIRKQLGYLPTNTFRDWYNEALFNGLPKDFRKKLFGAENPASIPDVTFAHISALWDTTIEMVTADNTNLKELIRRNECPLKIVSTDVTQQKLCVHPDDSSLDLPVADAVAASIAIPGVFQAKSIELDNGPPTHHVDGGALSNFPAWLFENQLEPFGQAVPILGFELIEKSENEGATTNNKKYKPTLTSFARDFVSTIISGSKKLSTRSVPELYTISIPTSASTFAFEQDLNERRITFREGHEQTKSYLEKEPTLVTSEQMGPVLHEIFGGMLVQLGDPQAHLRVNIIVRNTRDQFQVRYRYNMDYDTDDYLHFEQENAGGVGVCWRSVKPIVTDLEDARQTFADYFMSKYEQALVRPSLKSLLSVPIFDPSDTEKNLRIKLKWGILNFDSDDDLLVHFRDASLQKWATDAAFNLAINWFALTKLGRRMKKESRSTR